MIMMQTRISRLEAELIEKRERRALYIGQEKTMLTGGVQSYGIGSRNRARYNTDLAQIRAAIKELSDEIKELEAQIDGGAPRKRVALIYREW